MSYSMNLEVTPICTACGKELWATESTTSTSSHRKLFIEACKECFVHKDSAPQQQPSGGEK